MQWIYVTDAQGRTYKPTYPKRAKGLVKKGRARFVAANTICLSCPPESWEGETMQPMESSKTAMNLTAAEIFTELQQMRQDTEHLRLALEKLEKVPTDDRAEAAVCQEKISAVRAVVTAREETNQALIHLYEKMYDDIYYESEPNASSETV